jgi:hypothetical protein
MAFHEVAEDFANTGDVEWGWVRLEDYLQPMEQGTGR